MKIEREKKETNDQLKLIADEIEAFTKKMVLCGEQALKIEADSKQPRLIELLEKEGDRKYLRNNLQKNGTDLLRERKAYVLCHIKKNGEEEVPENIVIDGFCMRTPEEDVKWEEEQLEKEAAAQKGGKKAPPPKKK